MACATISGNGWSSWDLPGQSGHVGVTAKDNRRFVEAVLYRLRAGIPWRDLPACFGNWHRVYVRFNRWSKQGVWQRVFEQLAKEADNEYAMIDSTIVRAHRSAPALGKRGHSQRLEEARVPGSEPGRTDQQDSRRL
jgi:transposase